MKLDIIKKINKRSCLTELMTDFFTKLTLHFPGMHYVPLVSAEVANYIIYKKVMYFMIFVTDLQVNKM